MLNNNQGGLDSGNARNFSSQFGSTNQSQSGYTLGGNLASLHNLPPSYNLQNSLSGNRGIGGLPPGGNQQQQGRFGAQNLPSSLQQYSQVANRGGLPLMNGLNSAAGSRGAVGNPSLQSSRGQGPSLGSLSGLGPNLQRQAPQGIPGLSNLGQRGMPGLGLSGSSGHLGVQQLGSPARSTAMGLAYSGMGQAGLGSSHQQSGDLLAMINKTSGANQLSSLSGLTPAYSGQQPQPGPGQNSIPASQNQAQDKEQPTFDASEFPALGGVRGQGVGLSNGESASNLDGASVYANLSSMHKGIIPSEFNMQNEEFPALPGSGGGARNASEERQHAADQQPAGPSSQEGEAPRIGQGLYEVQQAVRGQPSQPSAASQEQLLRYYQLQGRLPAGAKGGPVGSAPGSTPSQAPGKLGSMQQAMDPNDRFGLLGLLTVIRMSDPDLTTLALGTDLTTLGLHLNSPDNVFKTFASPWADQPLKPEPDYKVPECYKQPAPRLKSGYFSKFQPDTLFYVFYSMPADEAQVFAADELANRGWWFHKELKLWLTRAPNTEPSMKAANMERGSYLVFDASTWEYVRKDNFVLMYDSLERPPSLPRPGMPPSAAPQPSLSSK